MKESWKNMKNQRVLKHIQAIHGIQQNCFLRLKRIIAAYFLNALASSWLVVLGSMKTARKHASI